MREFKEKILSEQSVQLESEMWKLFGELIDADCLNSSKPDHFLAMKNKLNIKLIGDIDDENELV